jgi:hypothetical protein
MRGAPQRRPAGALRRYSKLRAMPVLIEEAPHDADRQAEPARPCWQLLLGEQ